MSFKRVLSLVLVLCMVLSFFPASAFADEEFVEDTTEISEAAPEVIEEETIVEESAPEEETPAPAEEEQPAPVEEEQPAPAAAEEEEEIVEEEVVEEQQPASVEEEVVAEEVVAEAQTVSEDAMAATDPIVVDNVGCANFEAAVSAINSSTATVVQVEVVKKVLVYDDATISNKVKFFSDGTNGVLEKDGSVTLTFTAPVEFEDTGFNGDIVIGDNSGLTVTGDCSFGNVTIANADASIEATVTGGVFTSIDDCLIADGYGLDENDHTVKAMKWTAQIGTGAKRQRFTSFSDAYKVGKGDTAEQAKEITLLNNAWTGQNPFALEDGKVMKVIKGTYNINVGPKTPAYMVEVTQSTDNPPVFTYSSVPVVAKVGDKNYSSLAKAVQEAVAGDTVTLIHDVTLTEPVVIDKNLTIDLNGKNITGDKVRALWVKAGTVEIIGTGIISADGNGVSSSVIRVGDGAGVDAKLTVGENVTVTTNTSFGISVFGGQSGTTSSGTLELVVNGRVVSNGDLDSSKDPTAIANVGNSFNIPTNITINGTVECPKNYAIYHPGKGTLTINGTVSGLGGIEAKGGTVVINEGASITASATKQSQAQNGNGPSTSGYAIADVGNPGYPGQPTVTISGAVSGVVGLVKFDDAQYGTVTATNPESVTPADGYMWDADGKLVEIATATYTLTFNGNGGTWTGTGGAPVSSIDRPNQKINDPILNVKPRDLPVRIGYAFQGWKFEDGTAVTEESKMPAGNTTVYADWTIIDYAIQYELWGGTNDPANPDTYKATDGEVALGYAELTGSTFIGWCTPTDTGYGPATKDLVLDAEYVAENSKVVEGQNVLQLSAAFMQNNYNVTFTCGEGNPTATVKFDDDDVLHDWTNENKHYNDAIHYPVEDPVWSGYTFIGWKLDDSELLIKTEVLPQTCPAADCVYTAVWSDADVYTIEYTGLEGAVVEPENPTTYTVEDEPFTLNNPTKEGYTFKGWKSSDGGEAVIEKTIDPSWAQNLSYQATWEKTFYAFYLIPGTPTDLPSGGTVTIKYNGVAVENPYARAFAYEAPIKPVEVTCEGSGYVFDGWVYETVDEYGEVTQHPYDLPETMPALDKNAATFGQAYDSVNRILTLKGTWVEKGVTVTFNFVDAAGNKIADTKTETGKFGEELTMPDTDLAGYTFVEWRKDGAKVEPTPKTFPAVDTTFNAVYSVNDYTLTLDLVEGKIEGVDTPVWTRPYGTELPPIKDPTKAGYTFEGWVDEAGEPAEIPATMPAEDVTLTAQWKLDSYAITYDLGGGTLPEGQSNPASYTVESGASVVNPVKEGNTFEKWSVVIGDAEPVEWSVGSFTPEQAADICDDLVYTAIWTPNSYTYNFDTDCGTVTQYGSTATLTDLSLEYGKAIKAVTATRDGYKFDGFVVITVDEWGRETKTPYEIPSRMPALDLVDGHEGNTLTLHGTWTPIDYTMTYDYDGGTLPEGKSNPASYNVESGATVVVPEKEGNDFDKWSVVIGDAENPVVWLNGSITPDQAATICADLAYTATWAPHTHKVTFAGNGGTWTVGTATWNNYPKDNIAYGTELSTILPPEPTRPGYSFTGWEDIDATMPDKDVTYQAMWSLDDASTITYVLDGGVLPEGASNPGSYTAETPAFTLVNPTKDGYTFTGWTCKEETALSGKEVRINPASFSLIQPLTFTAGWKVNTYKIVLNATDDTNISYKNDDSAYNPSTHTLTLAFGAPIKAFTVNRPGYAFDGWTYTVKDAWDETETFEYDLPRTMPALDQIAEFGSAYNAKTMTLTLDANFSADEFNLTYELDGGVLPEGVTAPGPETASPTTESFTLVSPSRTGYSFNGWKTYQGGAEVKDIVTVKTESGVKIYSVDTSKITEETQFVAQWAVQKFTLTIKTENGEDPTVKKLSYGAAVTKPQNPTRTGYTFTGWDQEFPEAMPAHDVTITALWSDPIVYNVTYDLNGGTLPEGKSNPESYDVTTAPFTLNNPEMPGFTFLGWTWAGHDTPTPDVTVTPLNSAKAFDFVANWTEASYTIKFFDGIGDRDSQYGKNTPQKPITAKYNAPIVAPPVPEREGYEFTGWELWVVDAWGEKTVSPYTFPKYMPLVGEIEDGDNDPTSLTLHAGWKLVTYPITYDLNGGTLPEGKSNPESYDVTTDSFTLNNPEMPGFTFLGWTWAGHDTPTPDVTINPATSAKAFDFVANWTEASYTIKFFNGIGDPDSQYGSKTPQKPITAKYNAPIVAPPVPEREGYEFTGWELWVVDAWGEKTVSPYTFPKYMPLVGEIEDGDNDPTSLTLHAGWKELEYSITYELHDGVLPEGTTNPVSYKTTDAVKVVAPSKTGHDFSKWIVTFEDGRKAEWNDGSFPANSFAENLKYEAVFTPHTHKVTFDGNGGTWGNGAADKIVRNDVAYGTLISTKGVIPGDDPVRPGYSFMGYEGYTSTTTMADEDMTFNALWTLEDAYKITYELDGGVLPEGESNPEFYTVETPTFKLVNPVKSGHTFDGWTCGTKIKKPVKNVTVAQGAYAEDLTFVAHFSKNTYRLGFDGNGAPSPTTIAKAYNEPIVKPDDPTRENYEFGGWFIVTTDAWGEKTWTEFDFPKYMPALDEYEGYNKDTNTLLLTAKWIAVEYSVFYDLKGGELPEGVTNPTTITIDADYPIVAPVKTGYDFDGWTWKMGTRTGTTTKDYEGVKKGEAVDDLYLTATWKAHTHTITFVGNGGNWPEAQGKTEIVRENVEFGTVIGKNLLPDPVPTFIATTVYASSDWDFDSWEGYTEGMTMPDEDVTFTANWKLHEYKITYNYDPVLEDGEEPSNPNPETFTVDEDVTFVDPSRDAYDFAGWGDSELPSSKVSFKKGAFHQDLTMNSKWTAKTHTLTFDGNGGTWDDVDAYGRPIEKPTVVIENVAYGATITDVYADVVKNVNPERTGYDFVGWEGFSNTDTMPNADKTYKAVWKAKLVTVEFLPENGASRWDVQVLYDDLIEQPEDPTWVGHTFLGWCTDQAGKQPFDFNTPVTDKVLDKATGKVNLYGSWEINKYTVTFDSDGGSVIDPKVVEYGKKVSKPLDPDKTGYVFLDWFEVDESGEISDTPFNFNKKITHDTTLKAKYEGLPITVIWSDDTQTLAVDTQYVGDPMKVYVPNPLPSKPGYMLDPDNLWDPKITETVPYVKSGVLLERLNWIKLNTVYFVRDGKVIQTIDVPMNQTLEGNPDVPVIPPKAGYKAVWMLDGEYFDLATPISEDKLTLEAAYVQEFLVKFVNYDGTLLSSALYEKGDTPVEPDTPTREATAEATYEFAGWTPAVAPVSADVTYTATYNETKNKYTVVFENYDGTVLQSSELAYGEMPEYKSNEKPIKPGTAGVSYNWTGWDPALEPVDGNATYTAVFEEIVNEYTITFKDGDGKVLQSSDVAYGEMPEYTSNEKPTKAPTAEVVYTWDNGWDPEITEVTGEATYTATFTESTRMYTVTFMSEGTEYSKDEVAYKGKVAKPEDPTTEQVGVKFAGWFDSETETEFNFSTEITKDTVLNAVWVPFAHDAVFRTTLNMADFTGINVYVTLPEGEDAADYTVKTEPNKSMYPYDGQEVSLANMAPNAAGEYYIANVMKAASTEMTDTVKVTLLKNGEEVKSETYSVYSIVDERLKSGDLDEARDRLNRALLQYGRLAQIRFEHKTDDMPEVTGAPALTVIPDSYAAQGDPTGFGAYITNFEAKIEMADAVKMNVYLTPAAGYGIDDFEITMTCAGAVAPVMSAPVMRSGKIFVQISGLLSYEMDKDVQITVTLKGTPNTSATWTRSLITCAYENYQAATTDARRNLMMSVYQYFLAAKNRFGA